MADFLVEERPESWGIDTKPFLNPLGSVEFMIDLQRETDFSSLSIQDFTPYIDVLTPENPLYIGTVNGQFQMETCYNDAFYTHQEVHDFMDRIFAILESELGVSVPRASKI